MIDRAKIAARVYHVTGLWWLALRHVRGVVIDNASTIPGAWHVADALQVAAWKGNRLGCAVAGLLRAESIPAFIAEEIRRAAEEIDREHPGPPVPGTHGAAWASFAVTLRRFADEITR